MRRWLRDYEPVIYRGLAFFAMCIVLTVYSNLAFCNGQFMCQEPVGWIRVSEFCLFVGLTVYFGVKLWRRVFGRQG